MMRETGDSETEEERYRKIKRDDMDWTDKAGYDSDRMSRSQRELCREPTDNCCCPGGFFHQGHPSAHIKHFRLEHGEQNTGAFVQRDH